jgi:hypothetical protein
MARIGMCVGIGLPVGLSVTGCSRAYTGKHEQCQGGHQWARHHGRGAHV